MPVINFFKEHSYTMIRMLIYQVGMTVFGLMLAMATATNETLLLLTSLFSIAFYLCLIYMMTWEHGAKDKIRIDGGRMNPAPYKGMLIALGANTVNIALGLLTIIGYFCTSDFEAGIPAWSANMYAICGTIAKFIQAMYTGVLYIFAKSEPLNSISMLIIVIPAILVSGFGYLMGSKEKRLFGFISPKPNTKDAEKKGYSHSSRPTEK